MKHPNSTLPKRYVVLGALAVLVCLVAVWWLTPKHFLRGVKSEEVSKIEVLDGNTGHRFAITDSEDIAFLLEQFQSVPMNKEQISMGMGSSFRMLWRDRKGRELDSFTLQTENTIREGVVFYRCDGTLIEAQSRLQALEEELCQNP